MQDSNRRGGLKGVPCRLAAADGGQSRAAGAAVGLVAQQRVPQVARVHADLVRSPRAQAPLHARRAAARQGLQHAVLTHRMPPPAAHVPGSSCNTRSPHGAPHSSTCLVPNVHTHPRMAPSAAAPAIFLSSR
jgi:hypothetical protein